MTNRTVIPAQPESYADGDFGTATSRVRSAREKLLKDAAARSAHDALVRVIDERVAQRSASLAQLRKAIGLTQAQVAETLGIDQAEVSKLERRENLQLATLERFIEATGGILRISAIYGDVEVQLSIGDLLAEVAQAADQTTSRRPKMPAEAGPKKVPAKRTGISGKAKTSRTTAGRSTKSSASSARTSSTTGRRGASSRGRKPSEGSSK